MAYEEAEQARRELASILRRLPGFAGVGLVAADGAFELKVNFTDEPFDDLPAAWHGMPVTTDVVGRTRAY